MQTGHDSNTTAPGKSVWPLIRPPLGPLLPAQVGFAVYLGFLRLQERNGRPSLTDLILETL